MGQLYHGYVLQPEGTTLLMNQSVQIAANLNIHLNSKHLRSISREDTTNPKHRHYGKDSQATRTMTCSI